MAYALRSRSVVPATCCTSTCTCSWNAEATIDDDDKCTICLEPMDVEASKVTLRCGHVFHGTCIVDALRRNSSCPLCRDTPRDDDYYSDSGEWVENESPPADHVTFGQAITNAKRDARTNKNVKRSFDTVKKWKLVASDATKELRAAQSVLRPIEDALDKKIEAYSDKLWSQFETKHADLLQRHDEARARKRKAKTSVRTGMAKLARKYGYDPRSPW